MCSRCHIRLSTYIFHAHLHIRFSAENVVCCMHAIGVETSMNADVQLSTRSYTTCVYHPSAVVWVTALEDFGCRHISGICVFVHRVCLRKTSIDVDIAYIVRLKFWSEEIVLEHTFAISGDTLHCARCYFEMGWGECLIFGCWWRCDDFNYLPMFVKPFLPIAVCHCNCFIHSE